MERHPYKIMFITVSEYTGRENGIENTNKCQKTKRIVDSVKAEIQDKKPILYGGLFSKGNKYAEHAQEELQKILEYAILPCTNIVFGFESFKFLAPQLNPDPDGHVIIITDKKTVRELADSIELIPTPYGSILPAAIQSSQ